MTTVVHLSDFHFGTDLPRIADALVSDVIAQHPDLVAFSGDVTQRALAAQYHAAHAYFARFPAPWIAVPGNHDIPLYNPVARALRPLDAYREHIATDIEPSHFNDQIAAVSISTARHYLWKDGSVSSSQLRRMQRAFRKTAPSACRIVMMHHPCLVPPEFPVHNTVGNAKAALGAFSRAKVDVVLTGHMHDAFVVRVEPGSRRPHPVVLSQAGTAISSRRRSQPNSYNIVTVTDDEVIVTIRMWGGNAFGDAGAYRFPRG